MTPPTPDREDLIRRLQGPVTPGVAQAGARAVMECDLQEAAALITAQAEKIERLEAERNTLAGNYLGLTKALYGIVEEAPKTEPPFKDPVWGDYLSSGNTDDCVNDGMLWEEWRIAQVIASALYENAPDGDIDVWADPTHPARAALTEGTK